MPEGNRAEFDFSSALIFARISFSRSLSTLETLEILGGRFGPAGTRTVLVAGRVAFGGGFALGGQRDDDRSRRKNHATLAMESVDELRGGIVGDRFDLHGIDVGRGHGQDESDDREHLRSFCCSGNIALFLLQRYSLV